MSVDDAPPKAPFIEEAQSVNGFPFGGFEEVDKGDGDGDGVVSAAVDRPASDGAAAERSRS